MDSIKLKDEGVAAYEHKQYQDAVKKFSRALAASKGSIENQLLLLDLRCKAHCKLNKNELAMQDARHMIHLGKKKSAAGYFRCSQVERTSGNFKAAARWLEHGSKNVPQHKSAFMAELKKVQELAAKHTSLQNQRDPFESVPLEVLQYVLSYLTYREAVILLRVCRAWKRLLSALPPLNASVDFTAARTKVSNQACLAALRRLGHVSHHILLSSLSIPAARTIESWLYKSTNLERLEQFSAINTPVSLNDVRFERLGRLQSLRIGEEQNLSLDTVFRIMAKCQTLEDVYIGGIQMGSSSICDGIVSPQTLRLSLVAEPEGVFNLPTQHLSKFPNLQSLRVDGARVESPVLDLTGNKHLHSLRLQLSPMTTFKLQLPESLVDFRCTTVQMPSWNLFFSLDGSQRYTKLQNLALDTGPTVRVVEALGNSQFPPCHLSSVDLTLMDSWRLDQFVPRGCKLFEHCRRLSLCCDSLRNNDINLFSDLFPALQELTLQAPFITGAFVSDLVNRSKGKLRFITLTNCYQVSFDIVAWLHARGVKCDLADTNKLKESGQRIRDA